MSLFYVPLSRGGSFLSRIIVHVTSFLKHVDVWLLALLIQFFSSLAFNLMNSYVSLFINQDLQYSLIEATYWTGVYQLVGSGIAAVTATFTGFLCDRLGLKKMWLIIIFGNIIAYAGLALSTNVFLVILFRGLQGSFAMSTVVFAFSAVVASTENLKKSLSYQLAAMTLGQLIGPGIGGLLAATLGYRLTFATASLLFVPMIPVVSILKTPSPVIIERDESHFVIEDLKPILPDSLSLILVYMCINYIRPIIPWFLSSLGVPYDQLIMSTAAVTMLSGLAFAVGTSLLTRVVTDRTLPILPVISASLILATAFSQVFYQFLLLQAVLLATLAGIPPNLFGGKSARRGLAMGFLNSARFLGQAIGPFLATSILGDGQAPRALYVFITMAGVSLVASLQIYLTHSRKAHST